ncbi:16S rRNA (cytosine(967)-C(5))-methyltransferase RsmB [Sedimenticola sp.]|uniref:16S rRNA (cytosine(967)-C(5))-methyltransferase RsmB n=1 Tax=Sedimenticola sp. TaxID=1940285 RepID=UPI0025880D15|nr:16S rRNA (cytosine(967)-C(5))-methyltransferase RsmB [Sedimenticola sp.]MCW8903775.1 16S rRNA (cytosine(967)-C(5))-methyltransferase RsmB [Sedimenticola sp.]
MNGRIPDPGNPRVAAARLLRQLADGRSISDLLEQGLDAVSPRDRGLVKEFCFGVARWRPRLERIAGQLLSKPIKPKEGEVQALILLGLYQLIYMRVAPHAAVAETVEAARLLRKAWAVGLINALLRRFQRERETLLALADADPLGRYAMPGWLLKRIRTDWPEHWEAILQATNCHPPMSLRVNLATNNREQYLSLLAASGIETAPIPHVPSGLVLGTPMDAEALPGFAEGRVSVQDGGAQLAAVLLDLQAGQQVLDACAAPGGKSGHIMEAAAVQLTAMDLDQRRLERVRQNLQRLWVTAAVAQGDAAKPQGAWADRQYDRILLDVPCSATGVIRRHPDIKLLRRAQDIPALVKIQGEILRAVWPLLKPGGLLLYATCSLLSDENEGQVRRFLEQATDARERVIMADWGHCRPVGRQTLPGEATMDGFYYACLEKI